MATSRAPLVVAVMSLLIVGLVTTLWLAITTVSGSYQLQQGESEINALNEHKEQLMRQVSTRDSTPALQRHAAELGMVSAPEPAHLVANADGSTRLVGEPTAAEGAQAPPPPQPVAGGPEVAQQRQASPIPAVEGR